MSSHHFWIVAIAITGSSCAAGEGNAVLDMFQTRSGNGNLASGPYEGSDVDTRGNSCEMDESEFQGGIFDLVVEGSDIAVNGYTGQIHDGVFDTQDAATFDYWEDGYDCILDLSGGYDGYTTQENEARAEFAIDISADGSECELLFDLDFPCSTRIDFTMTRLDIASVADGPYSFTDTGFSPDECGYGDASSFYAQYSGGNVTFSTSELEIDLGDTVLVYEVDGFDLYDPSSPGSATFDFNDPQVASDAGLGQTYNCVVTQNIQFAGSVTGVNEFRLEDIYDISGTGSGCSAFAAAAGFSQFPCVSVDFADAELN